MEMIKKEIEVPKEISELADGMANIVVDSYDAFKDGFQAGQDLPVILTSAVANLPVMVGGIDQLGDEWKNAKSSFILAWLLAGEKVFEKITEKKEAPVAPTA